MQKAYLNARPYAHLANPRTLLTLLISAISCYCVIHFRINFQKDVLVLGLILSFPVVFSLQSAFKRRDKALEYLSLFKAGTTIIYRTFLLSKKLSEEQKAECSQIICHASTSLMNCLKDQDAPTAPVYADLNEIFVFLEKHRKEIGERSYQRILRYMRDVYESSSFLLGLKSHRTVAILRVFAFIFINLFPLLQATMLLDAIGNRFPQIFIYLGSAITALALITMYNIQLQLEYPFDQIGDDDVHLDNFEFEPGAHWIDPSPKVAKHAVSAQEAADSAVLTTTVSPSFPEAALGSPGNFEG